MRAATPPAASRKRIALSTRDRERQPPAGTPFPRPHPSPPETPGPLHGFTLVELLAVVGMIALLIAILMPVLSKAREHANRVKCAANLRSIGQALIMYTQRYGCYPSCILRTPTENSALWPFRLRMMLDGEQRVFDCPAQDPRCEWRMVPLQPGGSWRAREIHARFGLEVGEPLITESTFFSYGYNLWGTHVGSAPPNPWHTGLGSYIIAQYPPDVKERFNELRPSRVRVPADMIAVTDSTADGRWDWAAMPNHPDPRLWPGKPHGGGANVLFCDGHVQWYAQSELLASSTALIPKEYPILRMWNNTHMAD